MASIRNLKKSIHVIASELFSEGLFIQWFGESKEPEKIDETLNKILEKQTDFLARANHPDGTKNKKVIKAYYQSLISDINAHIADVMKEFVTLQKK